MSNIIVTHKIYGEGTVESIEWKAVFENTYFTAHFKGDGSYRKFLIFDKEGKPNPFLKFFANNPDVISFFESYKAHYFDSSEPFPEDMIHITPEVVEEDIKKEESNKTTADVTVVNTVEESAVEETVMDEIHNKPSVTSQEVVSTKRGRGRPKKSEVKISDVVTPELVTPVKRGRGRPKKQ